MKNFVTVTYPKEKNVEYTHVKFQTMVDILSALLLIRRYVDWKLSQEKPFRDNQNTTKQPRKFLVPLNNEKRNLFDTILGS